jgi:hypothetical protein
VGEFEAGASRYRGFQVLEPRSFGRPVGQTQWRVLDTVTPEHRVAPEGLISRKEMPVSTAGYDPGTAKPLVAKLGGTRGGKGQHSASSARAGLWCIRSARNAAASSGSCDGLGVLLQARFTGRSSWALRTARRLCGQSLTCAATGHSRRQSESATASAPRYTRCPTRVPTQPERE